MPTCIVIRLERKWIMALQRPKKSELSGWQLSMRKNFPDEVRKSCSRKKCVNRARDKKVCANSFCDKKVQK